MLSLSIDYDQQFAEDIVNGLSNQPKRLYSKYFYDETGDLLFQEIMQLPEYYLTRAEYEILTHQKENLLSAIQPNGKLQLIEFGAGDGLKTKVLLEYFLNQGVDFEYIPIDISESVLLHLTAELKEKFPDLEVRPYAKQYFEALSDLRSDHQKVILFLGSNIGNFSLKETKDFMRSVNDNLNSGDQFLIGVDLKKDPKTILEAYNDSRGMTKAFNLNLLARINCELDANFELNDFEHFPTYDPFSGECKSYLISKKKQIVEINKLGCSFHFDKAEPIFMEVSKKYDIEELEVLAKESNFKSIEHFFDCKHHFVNSLWKK